MSMEEVQSLETWKRRALRAEALLDTQKPLLRDMSIDGGLHLEIQHWAVKLIGASLAATLQELGGDNFVTMEVCDGDLAMVVTIQKKWGQSPAQVIGELRAEIQKLKGE